jgi:hypothetical protein
MTGRRVGVPRLQAVQNPKTPGFWDSGLLAVAVVGEGKTGKVRLTFSKPVGSSPSRAGA